MKLLLQVVMADDPLLKEKFTDADVKQLRKSEEKRDTGVLRTFVLGLIPGAKESVQTVQFIFNSVNLPDLVRECAPQQHNIQLISPVDMKMASLMLGIDQNSSTFPLVYNLWSPFSRRSKPTVLRTVETALSAYQSRQKALQSGPESAAKPALFDGAIAEPIDFLKCHFETDLLEIFVPPQLHLTLAVNIFLKFLKRLFPQLYSKWITATKSQGGLELSPDPQHGGENFNGNACREILRTSHKLREFSPSPEQVTAEIQSTWAQSSSSSNFGKEEVASDPLSERFQALRDLTVCFEDFDEILHRTTSPKLFDDWSESFTKLRSHFELFTTSYRLVFPPRQNRSLLTPKLHVLMYETPQWIERHQVSLCRISEQAFEGVHHNLKAFQEKRNRTRKMNKKKKLQNAVTPEVEVPSEGTRSGTQKRRKLAKKKADEEETKVQMSIDTLFSQSSTSSSRPDRTEFAQAEDIRLITAYTVKLFPAYCQTRLRIAADRYVGGNDKPAPWNL
jgi:hypothetical protein